MGNEETAPSLAQELTRKFARSPEAKAALGLAEEATEEAQRTVQDLFTMTVRTTLGEGADRVQITTHWSLDGDLDTTITPRSADLADKVTDYHMQQFQRALDYRLRLIEAVLRLAKVSVSLV